MIESHNLYTEQRKTSWKYCLRARVREKMQKSDKIILMMLQKGIWLSHLFHWLEVVMTVDSGISKPFDNGAHINWTATEWSEADNKQNTHSHTRTKSSSHLSIYVNQVEMVKPICYFVTFRSVWTELSIRCDAAWEINLCLLILDVKRWLMLLLCCGSNVLNYNRK